MQGLLDGDVAVITGAARGNGLAMAHGLARAGAAVALLDLDGDAAEAAARRLGDEGARAIARPLDVGDPEACRRCAAEVEAALGPASVLVNNAGVLFRDGLDAATFERTWDSVFRVNVDGSMHMVRALAPQLRATRGRIVNVGSITSFLGAPGALAYTASKGAIAQLTKSLAIDLAADGIRVNAIAPGRFATAMTAAYRDEPAVKAAYFARTPLKRYGEPEDLVGPVVFLASSLSAYVTGVLLPVDGGYLAG